MSPAAADMSGLGIGITAVRADRQGLGVATELTQTTGGPGAGGEHKDPLQQPLTSWAGDAAVELADTGQLAIKPPRPIAIE